MQLLDNLYFSTPLVGVFVSTEISWKDIFAVFRQHNLKTHFITVETN